MSIEFIYPEFEVIQNENPCIPCRICQQQCANGVHSYNSETKQMVCDESNCVNCQRCVSFCPTRALKIVKSDCSLRENANWPENMMKEIYKQANSGGVLLSSMGNPNPLPVYWDRILINASQVTNPPIDPAFMHGYWIAAVEITPSRVPTVAIVIPEVSTDTVTLETVSTILSFLLSVCLFSLYRSVNRIA